MITFRCTERVRKRFRIHADEREQAPTNRLGDWYANLLNIGRTRWVPCVSERSLLPVLVPARKADFPARFGESLAAVLGKLGVPDAVAAVEVRESLTWQFGKTQSRQVLGSMNDFAFCFPWTFRHTDDPVVAAAAMADTPCSPLGMESPDRVTFSLLGLAGEPRRVFTR